MHIYFWILIWHKIWQAVVCRIILYTFLLYAKHFEFQNERENHRARLGIANGTEISGFQTLAWPFIRDSEKAMAPHSSTFAWKIPWTEEPGRLQSMGSLESDTTERLPFHFSLSCIGEVNGNPLRCSCLENPRDGGAWWAAISGVAQSQTQLKRLSSSSSHKRLY